MTGQPLRESSGRQREDSIGAEVVSVADSLDRPAVPGTPDPEPTPSQGRSLRSRVGRGAAWAVLANFTIRFASIAITAVLARLLSKEDFGVFAIAIAVYAIVSSLAELGMGSAVARSASEPEEIAPTVTSISIIISLCLGAGMAIGAPGLASVLGQPEAARPLRILSLCLVLTGVFTVPGAQLVREFRQGSLFLATIVGFLVSNPVLVVLAVHGNGAEAFAWSRVVGQLATGIVLVVCVSRRYWPGWKRYEVVPLLRFGLPLSIGNLVNWSLLNADYLILGRFVDASLMGVYMIAFNVANWTTSMLGSVLNTVVVPAFGRMADHKEQLRRSLVSACQLVALLAFPIGAVSVALSEPIITTVFGEKWREASPVMAVLALYGVLYAFSLLFANVLVATGHTFRLLIMQLSWVAVLVPAMLFGLHRIGLTGVAWAHVVTIGLVAVPLYVVSARRATGIAVGEILVAVRRPAVAAMIAGLVGAVGGQLFSSGWVSLLVGGSLAGLTYLAMVWTLLARWLPSKFVPRWLPTSMSGRGAPTPLGKARP